MPRTATQMKSRSPEACRRHCYSRRPIGLISMLVAVLCFGAQCVAADEAELSVMTRVAMTELKTLVAIHDNTWGMGKSGDVKIEQGSGKIVWTFRNGQSVEAPVQIVGTYDPRTTVFLWAWANHTILGKLHAGASRIRAYGDTHDIGEFTSRSVRVSPSRAWEFAAIANYLTQSNGACRASVGGIIVYVTFGKIRLQAAAP